MALGFGLGFFTELNKQEDEKRKLAAETALVTQKAQVTEDARVRALLEKRQYDENLFTTRQTEQRKFDRDEETRKREKDNYVVALDEETGSTVNFYSPVQFDKLSDTEKLTNSINIIQSIKTDKQKEAFIKQAKEKGWGDNVYDSLSSIIDQQATGGTTPFGVSVPALNFRIDDPEHVAYGFSNNYNTRKDGINISAMKERPFSLYYKNMQDGTYQVRKELNPEDDDINTYEMVVVNNSQFLNPNSSLTDVYKPDGRHIAETNMANLKDIRRFKLFGLPSLNFTGTADSADSLQLKNIWESHFDTPAVQPTKDDNGETITEAQGIGIDVLVRDGDGIKTETIYYPVNFDLKSMQNNWYAANYKAQINQDGLTRIPFNSPRRNTAANSSYAKKAAMMGYSEQGENYMFQMFDIFNNAIEADGGEANFDPGSIVGKTLVKVFNITNPDGGQLSQLVSGLRDIYNKSGAENKGFINDKNQKQVSDAFSGLEKLITKGASGFANKQEWTAALDQLSILLAYTVALQMQGGDSNSARISDKDFEAARNAIIGNNTDSIQVRMKNLVRHLNGKAEEKMAFKMVNNSEGFDFDSNFTTAKDFSRNILNSFDYPNKQDRTFYNPYKSLPYYLMTDPNKAQILGRTIANSKGKDPLTTFSLNTSSYDTGSTADQ